MFALACMEDDALVIVLGCNIIICLWKEKETNVYEENKANAVQKFEQN